MKKILKTIAGAAIGGAGAAVAGLPLHDPALQGKAAAMGAVMGAAGVWAKQATTLKARGVAAVAVGISAGAADAAYLAFQSGTVDPQSLATVAIMGAITTAFTAQSMRAPGQPKQ